MVKEGDKITARCDFDPSNTEMKPTILTGVVARVYDSDKWIDLDVEVIEKNKWGTRYKTKRVYSVKTEWIVR